LNLFGFEIRKKDIQKDTGSVVSPTSEDGSTVVASASAYYGMVMDIEGIVKNENDLIRRYREVAQYADTDAAIEDIVNEAIISEDGSIKLDLDKVKLSDAIKKKMQDEFQNVLHLLRFSDRGHDIFRSWYIDGRVYYHIILDENNPKAGIAELRYVDPRKIRRIKNIEKSKNAKGVEINKVIDEYYLYNDKGITEQTTQGVKLTLDSVIHAPSGLVDANTGMMLSNLHKAIKPVNQLKMIEDAVVIYRISRAPERRVFYIDVGNLPKLKAEQYVNDIMNKFRNKVVYDATTGEVRDDRKHLSMMEDFWMPRREGGKGTEITTLPGGQNLGDIQDIQYFQQKLYQALNVPLSRLQQQQGFSLGRSTEITRDEIKFSKFIARLRKRFNALFYEALRVQLIAKNIIRPEEWDDLRKSMTFVYDLDNHFTELKDNEILMQRIQMLQQMEQYVGKYYSASWVKKNILQLTDDEIKEMESEIEEDRNQQLDDAKHQGNINTLVQPQQVDDEQQNTQQ
jgi:hypothetical protein